MGFTKAEMIGAVAKHVGITKADAERAVEMVVNLIAGVLVATGRIDITGLGVLTVKTLAASSRPNIQDRTKMVHTPARQTVKFRPSPKLKAAVNS